MLTPCSSSLAIKAPRTAGGRLGLSKAGSDVATETLTCPEAPPMLRGRRTSLPTSPSSLTAGLDVSKYLI